MIACFSHFAQMYLLSENENKEMYDNIKKIIFKDSNEDDYSTISKYYNSMFKLFNDETINKFKELPFIPKRYGLQTIQKWIDEYNKYNPTAQCNATNRVTFYKMYKYYMKFFYPNNPIKKFSSTECGFTKVSDFMKGLNEIKKEELKFETINDPLIIEKYNLFIKDLEDNSDGIRVNQNILSELELKNKYLKYKAKYLNLKNNK